MRVCFLQPGYPVEMPDFVRGLSQAGAEVLGVGSGPVEGLPDKARAHLAAYLQVPNVLDEDDLVRRTVAWCRELGGVERVESTWEPLVLAAARIREALGLPGMSLDTVRGFRDKELMKERIRAAGLRVPRSRRVRSPAEARAAVAELGFPVILKPIAGAGSADTWRVGDARELEAVLARMGHVTEASCEEFVEGEELTYDTVCVAGRPVYENVAWYLPRPLVARQEEWIAPYIVTMRDLSAPDIRPGVELGRGVLEALGMGSGFTHLEWYRKADGEVVFGEVGCRPGGARLVDQMNFTGDIDLYVAWARAVCGLPVEVSSARPYHCGIVFKRALGQGHITRVVGLEAFLARHGQHVLDETLLRPGQHRRDWLKTLVSDGYLLFRHPDFRQARAIARDFQENVQLLC